MIVSQTGQEIVDRSGRLVPATDDEVLAVENLLSEDEIKIRIALNTQESSECNMNYVSDSNEIQSNQEPEEALQLEDMEIGAGNSNVPPDPAVGSEKIKVQNQECIPSIIPTARDVGQSGCTEGCYKRAGGLYENKSKNYATDTRLMPDFSLLNGEIHLDDRSVRDLQETFRATFGRETSVKDKQWLKRRIIMGLTNSCDLSTTTFVVAENDVMKKDNEEIHGSMEQSLAENSSSENCESASTDKRYEICSNAYGTNIGSPCLQKNNENGNADPEHLPGKRVRKPTRRYIEEFSEGESMGCSAKLVPSVRHSEQEESSAVANARPYHSLGFNGICLTKKDSLGSSRIQIPYVSRVRRCRPRDNYMNLMKVQSSPSGMSPPTGHIKNNVASSEQNEKRSRNEVSAVSLSPTLIEGTLQQVAYHEGFKERRVIHLQKDVEVEHMDCSDDEVPTSNGGIRRKHHTAWTLNEVVKLVEGVAKYGVGRWSEIKSLSFASCSYRTSVDLKDKWRNLLRASAADLPARNVMHSSRKQTSIPIPASVLSRVRALAHLQTQISPSFSSGRFSRCRHSGKSVDAAGSGFL